MDIISKLVKDLKKYDPQQIILFGSSARGDSDRYSDLDVIVIKDTDESFLERLVKAARLIRSSLGLVDVFVYTPREFDQMRRDRNPFIERALKEGKVIYEKVKRK